MSKRPQRNQKFSSNMNVNQEYNMQQQPYEDNFNNGNQNPFSNMHRNQDSFPNMQESEDNFNNGNQNPFSNMHGNQDSFPNRQESPDQNLGSPNNMLTTFELKSRVNVNIDQILQWVFQNQVEINKYMGKKYHEYFQEKIEKAEQECQGRFELF